MVSICIIMTLIALSVGVQGALKVSAHVAAADVRNVARNFARDTKAETAVEQAAFSCGVPG